MENMPLQFPGTPLDNAGEEAEVTLTPEDMTASSNGVRNRHPVTFMKRAAREPWQRRCNCVR